MSYVFRYVVIFRAAIIYVLATRRFRCYFAAASVICFSMPPLLHATRCLRHGAY